MFEILLLSARIGHCWFDPPVPETSSSTRRSGQFCLICEVFRIPSLIEMLTSMSEENGTADGWSGHPQSRVALGRKSYFFNENVNIWEMGG
jgi:hypothetical protein